MHSWSAARTALLALLLLWSVSFAALSVDVMVRVWAWRSKFSGLADVLMLLGLEGMRTLAVVAAAVAAVMAARRASRGAMPAALAFTIALASITLSKFIGSSGFPGAAQAAFLHLLQRNDVPLALVQVVFGHAESTGWLALAGLVAFLAHYPRSLTMADVEDAGAADRRGAMRSVALAGADVGDLSRRLTARVMAAGGLRTHVVWTAGLLLAVVHTAVAVTVAGAGPLLAVVAVILAAAACAAALTLHRTALLTAPPDAVRTLAALRRGALGAVVLLGASAAAALLLPGGRVALLVLALAPLVLVAAVVRALRAA